jgi:hypothetical protein
LGEIKIPVPEKLEDTVVCDSLVDQIQKSFASFTAQEVKALTAMARNR